MKNLLKFGNILLLAAFCSLFIVSCDDDDDTNCYECLGYDDGTTSLEDLGTVCEGELDEDGVTITAESLDASILLYEGFGGTCTKQ